MRKDTLLTTAVLVALATFALSGCGADDSAPASAVSTSSTSSPPTVANNGTAQLVTGAPPAAGMLGASAPLAAGPAAVSDPITQSMQASLAADSQQVAPVMHYAPGDTASSN